jgi:hypothetical protein
VLLICLGRRRGWDEEEEESLQGYSVTLGPFFGPFFFSLNIPPCCFGWVIIVGSLFLIYIIYYNS